MTVITTVVYFCENKLIRPSCTYLPTYLPTHYPTPNLAHTHRYIHIAYLFSSTYLLTYVRTYLPTYLPTHSPNLAHTHRYIHIPYLEFLHIQCIRKSLKRRGRNCRCRTGRKEDGGHSTPPPPPRKGCDCPKNRALHNIASIIGITRNSAERKCGRGDKDNRQGCECDLGL